MRKQKKLINTLNGNGNVYKDGISISNVNYTIYISQEFTDDLPGIKEIKGYIKVVKGERNLTDGSVLTLKLADNREWQFLALSGIPIDARYEAHNVSGSGLSE